MDYRDIWLLLYITGNKKTLDYINEYINNTLISFYNKHEKLFF